MPGRAKRGNSSFCGATQDDLAGALPLRMRVETRFFHLDHVFSDYDYPHSIAVTDLDGDSDVDVLLAAYGDVYSSSRGTTYYYEDILYYENDGTQAFTERVLNDEYMGSGGLLDADLDGDGDIDVIFHLLYVDVIAWLDNDGDFPRTLITSSADGASDARAIDVDGDADIDLVALAAYDDEFIWFENDGSMAFTEHVVSTLVNYGWELWAGDIDGDGDVDVAVAEISDDTVAWFDSDSSGGDVTWTYNVLTTFFDGAHSVDVSDLDHKIPKVVSLG